MQSLEVSTVPESQHVRLVVPARRTHTVHNPVQHHEGRHRSNNGQYEPAISRAANNAKHQAHKQERIDQIECDVYGDGSRSAGVGVVTPFGLRGETDRSNAKLIRDGNHPATVAGHGKSMAITSA